MSNFIKVKFNDDISCVDGSYARDEIVSLSPEKAAAWCKTGQATRVEEVAPESVQEVEVKKPIKKKK